MIPSTNITLIVLLLLCIRCFRCCAAVETAAFFFSPMAQPSDPPLFSSRFEGGVLIAMVGWLLEGLNQLRVRISCFWGYMCKYFWWFRAFCIRRWLGIPEPPKRRPPYIYLTEEQLRRVRGEPPNGKRQQQPPRQEAREGFVGHTDMAPSAGLGTFPPAVRIPQPEERRCPIQTY